MGNKKIEDRNKLNANLEQTVIAASGITANTSTADGVVHRTVFTVPSTVQAVAGSALAWGIELGALPKCKVGVLMVGLDLDYVSSVADSEQMDIGVGTVVASGAAAVISGTSTFEDCLTGQTATALNGTSSVNYIVHATGELDNKDGSSTAKSLFLNLASTNSGITGNLTVSGEVTVIWVKI